MFALQKELSREVERTYTRPSVGERVRMQLDSIMADGKKPGK